MVEEDKQIRDAEEPFAEDEPKKDLEERPETRPIITFDTFNRYMTGVVSQNEFKNLMSERDDISDLFDK